MKKSKKIKVVERKLGRERAYGQIFMDKGLIEIDERLMGKDKLIVYLHEFTHWLYEEMPENEVVKNSEAMANFLWDNGFRKVDLK